VDEGSENRTVLSAFTAEGIAVYGGGGRR